MKALIAKAVGALLVLVLTFTLGYQVRDSKANRESLQAQLTYTTQLEEARKGMQEAMNDLSTKWLAHQKGAKEQAAGTVSRLTDAGITLRVRLADAKVASVLDSNRREPYVTAELHGDTSRFLIGEAQRADTQVTLLQEAIRTLQEQPIEQGRQKP